MKEELTKLVEETFRSIPLPFHIQVLAAEESGRVLSEEIAERRDSYFIEVLLTADPEDIEGYSFFHMFYNPREKRFEHGRLSLDEPLRGKGYGRMLVDARETLARKLGCERIRINDNLNPSFWEHMGFTPAGKYWEKEL